MTSSVGAIESHLTKDAFRNRTFITTGYVAELVARGYAASDVEQIVLDVATAKSDESSAAESAKEAIIE